MAGRTPNEALRTYLSPLQAVLRCVTQSLLTVRERARLTIDAPYSVSLADLHSVPLRGTFPLRLTVGQTVRIVVAEEADDTSEPFAVRTVQYLYAFSTPEDQEILSFHWTPEATGLNAVTTPHLHIGPAITGGQPVLRPGDLHKAHVPTGPIELASVVCLAIAEFGVRPLLSNWTDILRRAEDATYGTAR